MKKQCEVKHKKPYALCPLLSYTDKEDEGSGGTPVAGAGQACHQSLEECYTGQMRGLQFDTFPMVQEEGRGLKVGLIWSLYLNRLFSCSYHGF